MNRKTVATTKISQENLDRIKRLKITGYEPNDYIIRLALDALKKQKMPAVPPSPAKLRMGRTTKISPETLARIRKFKITGYEPNDYIIRLALDALEKKKGVKNE
jgi:hypothetical protein